MAYCSLGRSNGSAILARGYGAHSAHLFKSKMRRARTGLFVQGEATNGSNLRLCGARSLILQRQLYIAQDRRTGQEHQIQEPVCDVLANKRSIVVTFSERIVVFDAKTLKDVLTITTCYLSPGPNPNPVVLGPRWLAYSEKKLVPGRTSSGGSESEGVSSYTATRTVLYAVKSLGKGLRGLGETVASSLTGNFVSPITTLSNSNSTNSSQPGVVTILDLQATKEEKDDGSIETIVAHFAADSVEVQEVSESDLLCIINDDADDGKSLSRSGEENSINARKRTTTANWTPLRKLKPSR